MTDNGSPEAPPNPQKEEHTVIEEIEVAASDLVERVKELVEEGNVRHITIKTGDTVLLEVPVTLAVIAGGALALIWPSLAILAGIAALLTQVNIVVTRTEAKPAGEGKVKVEVEGDEDA